ncbi:MAG: Uma2 family endonuclease, partial [Cyanobacteria bacterium J06636_28]
QQLDSLEDYVLISQESQQVEYRRRISLSSWETVIYGAGDDVLLESIDLRFAIANLYRGLDGQAG